MSPNPAQPDSDAPLTPEPVISRTQKAFDFWQPDSDLPTSVTESEGLSASTSLDAFVPSQRSVLRWAMVALLVVLGVEWFWLVSRRPDPLSIQRGEMFAQQFRVDVNSATWVEWTQLEGIGPALAHRIIAEREVNGPFRTIEEVGRVPGIGPAKLDQMRPWLTIGHDIHSASVIADSSSSPGR